MELGVALVTSTALQPERWSGRGPDRPRMRAAAGMRVLATWNMLGECAAANLVTNYQSVIIISLLQSTVGRRPPPGYTTRRLSRFSHPITTSYRLQAIGHANAVYANAIHTFMTFGGPIGAFETTNQCESQRS